MMKSVEEYVERYRAVVQEAIPEEPVGGLAMVSTVGATKGVLTGALASPLVGMLIRRKGANQAKGFPMNSVIAVTPTRFVAFEYRPRGTGIKLKRRIVDWPRHQVRLDVVPPASSNGMHHLRFTLPDGDTYELELLRSIGQYQRMNDSFFAAVGLPSPY